MTSFLILIFLALPLQVNPMGGQEKAAGLPAVDVESFGAAVRAQIENVYRDAVAGPEDPAVVGRLAMTLHAYDECRPAAQVYRVLMRLQPNQFKWTYLLAVCQASLGNNQEAAATFGEALKIRPDDHLARLRLADLLFSVNRIDESRKLYEDVVAALPDAPQAHYGLGRTKSKLGDLRGAIASLRRAADLAPNWGAAHYALALSLRDAGETNEVAERLKLYQQNRNVRPVPVDPVLDEVASFNSGSTELLKRGYILESEGRLEESITAHERAIELNPQLGQAYINLIQLYARTGRYEKAEQLYRTVTAFRPGLAEAHYNIGVMFAALKRYADAGDAFQRAIESNPQYAEAHLNYGILLEREQRYDDALSHYRSAVENRPDLREARFQYARMLIFKGLMTEAIDQLKLTLAPEDDQTPRYAYALGAACARAGDRSNAIKYTRLARDKALALKQTELLTQIERDLRILEK